MPPHWDNIQVVLREQICQILRFSDISNDIDGISNRILSKELKVQYELTEHGDTLQVIISNLTD